MCGKECKPVKTKHNDSLYPQSVNLIPLRTSPSNQQGWGVIADFNNGCILGERGGVEY